MNYRSWQYTRDAGKAERGSRKVNKKEMDESWGKAEDQTVLTDSLTVRVCVRTSPSKRGRIKHPGQNGLSPVEHLWTLGGASFRKIPRLWIKRWVNTTHSQHNPSSRLCTCPLMHCGFADQTITRIRHALGAFTLSVSDFSLRQHLFQNQIKWTYLEHGRRCWSSVQQAGESTSKKVENHCDK